MGTKKVSFNIREETYDEIKDFCEKRDLKFSDFFRYASDEKLTRDALSMTIYIPLNGKIEKFEINIDNFDVDVWEASEMMQENVGAVCEGRLMKNENFFGASTNDMLHPNEKANVDRLEELLRFVNEQKDFSLAFYTKEKYPLTQ